ncbi:hypothetical protein BDZ91DRAFT_731872, partial [Kalaharituber pfeilii]
MDEKITSFISITGTTTKNAEGYLLVSDGNLEQAIQLFFDTGGANMSEQATSRNPRASTGNRPTQRSIGITRNELDDDTNMLQDEEDQDFLAAVEASRQSASPATGTTGRGAANTASLYDEDEAMARRLQEEIYADAGNVESGGVRAPIAKTTEVLVGPEDDYIEQMSSRARRRNVGRPGIFNQRPPSGSVWGEGHASRHHLAEATGGASEQTKKQQTLAEMYRPPYEIMEHLSFEEARDQAKEVKKWILINVQDSSIFDCQVLNRDIWKTKEVKDTIKENFIFLQYDRSGRDGQTYVRLYFPHAIDVPPTSSLNPFPIIAIVDPRTGEQVKVWSETPKRPLEFVMQLHEFLDRYSLHDFAKNPVQRQTKPKVDVDHMTEEEMLDLAMRNSLNNGDSSLGVHDPDELTRAGLPKKGKEKQAEEINLMEFEDALGAAGSSAPTELTPFQAIPKNNHHVEPPQGPGTTRIQFKLADGSRIVRRFALDDKVTRIYEFVKADLLPEQAAKRGEEVTEATSDRQFELVSMGKNLIDCLNLNLDQAGLKMGTVMIEFVDN